MILPRGEGRLHRTFFDLVSIIIIIFNVMSIPITLVISFVFAFQHLSFLPVGSTPAYSLCIRRVTIPTPFFYSILVKKGRNPKKKKGHKDQLYADPTTHNNENPEEGTASGMCLDILPLKEFKS